MIPRPQLLKAAKQASITSKQCYTTSSASFSPIYHMLQEQACLQLDDKFKCQKKKRRKREMGSNLHGFSLLLSLSLLPHPRCCWYVWLKALVVSVCLSTLLSHTSHHPKTLWVCWCVSIHGHQQPLFLWSKAHVKLNLYCIYLLCCSPFKVLLQHTQIILVLGRQVASSKAICVLSFVEF